MGIVLLLGFWSFSVTYTSFHFMIPSSPQALNFKVHRIKRRPSEIHDSSLNFFCLFFSHQQITVLWGHLYFCLIKSFATCAHRTVPPVGHPISMKDTEMGPSSIHHSEKTLLLEVLEFVKKSVSPLPLVSAAQKHFGNIFICLHSFGVPQCMLFSVKHHLQCAVSPNPMQQRSTLQFDTTIFSEI